MEENPRKKLKADLSDVASVEGYISKVSAAKISKNGTHYFNAVIQISDENISDDDSSGARHLFAATGALWEV